MNWLLGVPNVLAGALIVWVQMERGWRDTGAAGAGALMIITGLFLLVTSNGFIGRPGRLLGLWFDVREAELKKRLERP